MSGAFPAGTSITIFCGGHGVRTLVPALLQEPDVAVTLLVNGYDNGMSTGTLRAFLPGMLGVSDYRKNLVHHLDPDDPHDRALRSVLECRLAPSATSRDLHAVLDDLRSGRARHPASWCRVEHLTDRERICVLHSLERFEAYRATRCDPDRFRLGDCALANLVMGGIYLASDADFNRALDEFTALFGCPIKLLNVTSGANAFLAACKDDGEILPGEADIVGPQSTGRIRDLALLPEPLDRRQLAQLNALPPGKRGAWLRSHHRPPGIAPAAARAIEEADLIVYAAGTQHSSLLPSYLTRGVRASVARSRAAATVFLVNIREDHDIQGWDAEDLVKRALRAMGDPHNRHGSVSHVLYHRGRRQGTSAVPAPERIRRTDRILGGRWVGADLEDGVHTGLHCGHRTVTALADLVADRASIRSSRCRDLPGRV